MLCDMRVIARPRCSPSLLHISARSNGSGKSNAATSLSHSRRAWSRFIAAPRHGPPALWAARTWCQEWLLAGAGHLLGRRQTLDLAHTVDHAHDQFDALRRQADSHQRDVLNARVLQRRDHLELLVRLRGALVCVE